MNIIILINKKLATAIATGAILINTLMPAAAFADNAAGNLSNGAESSNSVNVTQNNTSTAQQNNAATISNNVTSSAVTGGNNADFNTGGNSSVFTGGASNAVSVSNAANMNQMSNSGSGSTTGAGNALLQNGANGAFSANAVNFTSNNNNAATQNNASDFTNNINSKAATGDNSGSDNTGGNTSLYTGPANNAVEVQNMANKNVMTGGSAAFGFGGGTTLQNLGNGALSNSAVNATENNSATATQNNAAQFSNTVTGGAFTGKNTGDFNTDGSTTVLTGAANNWTGVANTANQNIMDEFAGSCGCALTTSGNMFENAGNGAFSSSATNATMNNNQAADQNNSADFSNTVNPAAFTGANSASDGTGSFWYNGGGTGSSVLTGNAASQTQVVNTSNDNQLSNNGMTIGGMNFTFSPSSMMGWMMGL